MLFKAKLQIFRYGFPSTMVGGDSNKLVSLSNSISGLAFVDSQIMNQLSYEVLSARFSETGFVVSGNLDQGIAVTIGLLRNARTQIKAE